MLRLFFLLSILLASGCAKPGSYVSNQSDYYLGPLLSNASATYITYSDMVEKESFEDTIKAFLNKLEDHEYILIQGNYWCSRLKERHAMQKQMNNYKDKLKDMYQVKENKIAIHSYCIHNMGSDSSNVHYRIYIARVPEKTIKETSLIKSKNLKN